MNNPITVMTDKVMRMIKSMVYMAMRVSYQHGATAEDISAFLFERAPNETNMYHEGVVERVLGDLESDGKVKRSGPHWYPVGLVA